MTQFVSQHIPECIKKNYVYKENYLQKMKNMSI